MFFFPPSQPLKNNLMFLSFDFGGARGASCSDRCPVGSPFAPCSGPGGATHGIDSAGYCSIFRLSSGCWELSSLPVYGVHLLVGLGVLTNVNRKSASDARQS